MRAPTASRRTPRLSIGVLTLLAACATAGDDRSMTERESDSPTSTLAPLSTVTTGSMSLSTVTTESMSLGDLVIELLHDPELTAEVSVEATTQAPGVVFTSAGSGLIVGNDSAMRLEDDFSQLTHTLMDADGNILGPGGMSSRVSESRVIDGVLFELSVDGRWMRLEAEQPNTTLGHIIDRLRETPNVVEVGTVVRDGVELYHFQPGSLIEYEPDYFDIAPDQLTTFVTTTDLFIEDSGHPLIIEIQVGLEHEQLGAQVSTQIYRLSPARSSLEVERPMAWISAMSAGYELAGIDYLVPEDWQLVERSDSHVVLEADGGYWFMIAGGPSGGSDAKLLMDEFAQAQGARILGTEDFTTTMFEGVMADATGQNGEVGVLYATVTQDIGIVSMWVSPNQEPRAGLFEEVIATLISRNRPEDMIVPGETLGNPTLQMDVATTILASLDCEDTYVVYTRFASLSQGGWSEDWYLHSCDGLLRAHVDFAFADDGVVFRFEYPFEEIGVSPRG